MDESTIIFVFGSLIVAGLAASLHCIGMCGPIVVGFSHLFESSALTVEGKSIESDANAKRSSLFVDFACYHAGRIWTYAMLGFLAGLLGEGLRESSTYLQWQKPVAIVVCAMVIFSGVALLNIIPGLRIDALLNGCQLKKTGKWQWFNTLVTGRGVLPRLLLGAVMGLLPCGMIYAMLLVVATLPNPLWSAAGMVAFGIGTLPSMTSVVIGSRLVPVSWRAYGTRIAAVLVIAMGTLMLVRTILADPVTAACPLCPS